MKTKQLGILVVAIAAMLILSGSALAYGQYYGSVMPSGNNFGYGNAYHLQQANQPYGAYGLFTGPGNAYYRGQPMMTAHFSPGYTPRYGMSDLRTNAPIAYSPGFTPRYGMIQGGMNGGFAFSPGYTDQRYGLPLAQNGGFQFSPGYMPRYGMMGYDGAAYVNSKPRALYTG